MHLCCSSLQAKGAKSITFPCKGTKSITFPCVAPLACEDAVLLWHLICLLCWVKSQYNILLDKDLSCLANSVDPEPTAFHRIRI